MGSRERKRAERRKRKRRSAGRPPTGDAQVPEPDAAAASETGSNGSGEVKESFQERMARRAEERNVEARAKLEPLERGERPTAVTVGAAISVLLAVVFTVSAVIAAVGSVEISGSEPSPFPLAVFAGVLWLMAWGMWRARYWAVLGFQMLLVLFMLSLGLGLIAVSTVLQALGTVVLLAGAAALFYFMIRAMARIQMPELPGDR